VTRRSIALALSACLAPATAAWAQPGPQSPRIEMPRPASPLPPRDTSARPSEAPAVGTAKLHGRVVSNENGEPLRRATITAQPTRPPEMQRGGVFVPPRRYSARTDADGRFVITEVPAGEYSLTAQRPGYASQGYGQLRPGTPARRVTVADGAAVGPLDFSLIRGGVIAGRVVDDEGEPAERVQVRVVRQQRIAGRLRNIPVSMGDTTDDLGQYRLYGLAPGEYLVVAEPADRGMFSMGQGVVQGAGVDTIPTYGPGTANPADAQKVDVQAGVEASMDIQLVATKVATVSGRVLTSHGEPMAGGFVRLQASGAGNETLGMGRGGQILADGKFEIAAVPPGAYTLLVQPQMRGGPDQVDAATEGAIQPVSVEGEDVSLTIRTTPGSTAAGRVVLEGAAMSALGNRELRVQAMPTGEFMANMFIGPPGRGLVQPDLTFDVVGLRGSQALSIPLLPEGWWVKDVKLAGQSIFEGHDFGSGRSFSGIEIVVSARPTGLTGTVSGPTGSTATDYAVVLFPEDEERWERIGPAQMSPRAIRPGLDGTFKLPGLRPGTYYVLAVPVAEADMQLLSDSEHLRVLAGRARTVEVKDGEMATLTLTLVNR
jgi:hypothetical protein